MLTAASHGTESKQLIQESKGKTGGGGLKRDERREDSESERVKDIGAGYWSPRKGSRGGAFRVLTEASLSSEKATLGVQATKCAS